MRKIKLCTLTLLPAAMILTACGGDHTPPADTKALDVATKVANFAGDYSKMFASSGFGNGSPFNVEWSASEAKVANNQLHLTISKNAEGREYPYKGGEMRSLDFYGKGDFGVRMKPSATPGTASTFFTYTGEWDSESKHPSTGETDTRNPGNAEGVHDEIDIEFLGKDTTKVQFNYFTKGKGGHEYMYNLGFDASKEFHDYGFRWEESKITWFVDGKAVYQATEDIPTHPGRILTNYWCGDNAGKAWMGGYEESKASEAVYEWVSATATGTHTAKAPEQSSSVPTGDPGDWDKIDPIEIKLSEGCDPDYKLQLSNDKKSVDVSYENIPSQSYKNFAFILPEEAQNTDKMSFLIENTGKSVIQVRADVNAATAHGANNINAINTSATFKGQSIYTDTSWGGSKVDLEPGDKGLFEINYDGVPTNLMFMVDTSIYQDGVESHTGSLKISDLKLTKVGEDKPTEPTSSEPGQTSEPTGESSEPTGESSEPGEAAAALEFLSQGPYTSVTKDGVTKITYESVDDNTYANTNAPIASLLGEKDNCLAFDLKNNGEESVQINVKIGAYGDGGFSGRMIKTEESLYDYFGESDKMAQYNIGAGESRTCVFDFDREGAVELIEIYINSGWAAETKTHTNGNIEISNVTVAHKDINDPVAESAKVLAFASQGPYTVVTDETSTTITYESVDDNTYANTNASIASFLGDSDNCLAFDLKNNGEESVQINVKIGAYGDGGFAGRMIPGGYDYFGESDKMAQYNIGAGDTRTCTFNFDREGAVELIEIYINSGWAAETKTHTNGNIVISNVVVATVD